MATNIVYSEKDGCILLVSQPPFSMEKMQQNVLVVKKLMERHETHHLLVDARKLSTPPKTTDIFSSPAIYASSSIPQTTRIAILLADTLFNNPNSAFYENVCRNRGINLRKFACRDEAVSWLNGMSD